MAGKITMEEFQKFEKKYFGGEQHERFGQAFINTYGEEVGIPRDNCSLLWEQKNFYAARGLILSKYVAF